MFSVIPWLRRNVPLASLFTIIVLSAILTACSAPPAQAAQWPPTLQPTETAVPLPTPTMLPSSTPAALSTVNWSDVNLYKKGMNWGYEKDVDQVAADANRYFIVARLTFENDVIIRGAERVRYVNRSQGTLNEIVFRLYPNIPFMGGRMNVTHITVNDKVI